MADETGGRLPETIDTLKQRTRELEASANGFARAMTQAFTSAAVNGKQFDDVLKSLALRISDLALKAALEPLTNSLSGGLNSLFGNLFGSLFGGGAGARAGGAAASAAPNVSVNIATADAASFRRSESYITGQIARAVARGQRSL